MVEVSVGWFPGGGMIGDYMNKPLQGDMFQNFREKIMGVIPDVDTVPVKVKVEQPRTF